MIAGQSYILNYKPTWYDIKDIIYHIENCFGTTFDEVNELESLNSEG